MDFGGEVGGYFSDTTRTVVVGEAPAGFEEVYRLVQEAQDAAVRTVRPGVTAQDVDRAARRIIDTAGYGERFFHRTGHGIGLEVHEPPYIIEGNETVLTPGMTFSVEPGVYLEGRFGVRIEDIVAVTADGVERLNRSSRELQNGRLGPAASLGSTHGMILCPSCCEGMSDMQTHRLRSGPVHPHVGPRRPLRGRVGARRQNRRSRPRRSDACAT